MKESLLLARNKPCIYPAVDLVIEPPILTRVDLLRLHSYPEGFGDGVVVFPGQNISAVLENDPRISLMIDPFSRVA